MVKSCVNSACREEFKLLNAGDLYSREWHSADTEFFWICSACASMFDLVIDAMGCVSVTPRGKTDRKQPPHPNGHLRLISRAVKPVCRPDTLPSGEQARSFVFGAGPFAPRSRLRSGLSR
jgi:hypothetical protein